MSYQGASLSANTVDMNFQTSTLTAQGPPTDSLRGDRALFKRGGAGDGESGDSEDEDGQSFTGDTLSYNLNTERGRVVAARSPRREGYVEGNAVKVFEDSTLFVQNGIYTTCDCGPGETPSYSLRSDEMKIKDQWVYTGPIQLYLFNVPTPLWLPIGFLPNTEGRRSGPLPPEYGNDRRGFFLKDWGWYFALDPYTDLTVRASVWSQGSFEIRPRFRYKKRYRYDGDLELTYRREKIGEEVDPNFQKTREGQLRWNHSQDLSPTASINSNVNLVTSGDFARENSDDYNDAVRQEISSSFNYRKRWPNGGRSLDISANQQQQLQSGNVNLTLPNLGFSQNSFKPFRNERRIGDPRWYENIQTRYNLDVTNTFDFRPRDPDDLRRNGTPADSALADEIERADVDWYEALFNQRKYELATGNDRLYDVQAQHNVPLSATFRVDRYNLSLTPQVNYTSDWRLSTIRKTARRDSTGGLDQVVDRNEPGFYARHDFNTSVSAQSEVFGTFPIGLGPFQGLRHRVTPSLSINYQPNFNDPIWGRTRTLRFPDGTPVVTDSATGEVRRYDILGGGRVSGSTQQWRLDFSLENVFQTKRLRSDTTQSAREEVLTLLNVDVSGLSYNFAADSFRVSRRFSVNARTNVDPFDISVNTQFSPYALRRTGTDRFRLVDRLMIAESPLTPARLTDFQLSVGANFSSDDSEGALSNPDASKKPRPPSNQLTTLDVPWSFGLNLNYKLSKPQKEITNRSATLSVDFDLNVTPQWQVRGNTGYDFIREQVATTELSVQRNLGCWDMSFNWVPFGRFQKYGFRLQVSSGQLSELLQLQIPNQGGEGRLGGVGGNFQQTTQGIGQ
jgi:lipopolysaccharide assembly outer membrane protein LptD (OstA)